MSNPYSLLQNTKFKTYNERGHITPNFEYSEGIRPAGQYMPAPWLPAVRFNQFFEEFFVLSGGKPVAMDSTGHLVPAGLRLEAEAYKTAFDGSGVAAADAQAVVRYTADDVARGLRNAAGNLVVAGEPVVKSLFNLSGATAVPVITISRWVGIAMYNYFGHPGGDGENPARFNTHNFNLQNKVGFLCDYVIQVPVVLNQGVYDSAPFKGMGAMIATAVRPGEFVSYDRNSNFVTIGYDVGANDMGAIVGQVLSVDTDFPKDLLDKVRTQYNGFGELEKMPGSATGGKPDVLTYSGGYGLVTFNLINR